MLASQPRVRTLIVDDEPLARKAIQALIAADPDIQIIGECGDGRQALEAISELGPDLVFLDVQMPELSGIEVLKALGADRMPVVIFTTAYDRYALKAFEVHALDYLLKPFDDERFEQALARAKAQIRQQEIGALSKRLFAMLEASGLGHGPEPAPRAEAGRYLGRIMIKGSGPIFFLKVEDIDWIEAADYYAELHVGKATHLLRESLKSLDERLDPAQFMRIHRSTIINLDRVQQLQPDARGDYHVTLRDGTTLRLGRGRKDELQERLMGGSHGTD